MKFRPSILRFAACMILAGGLLPRTAPAADRNIDTNVVYPAAALIQNGGRILNVHTPPAGLTAATGNGTTDDTAAFQDAYDYIKTKFLASSSNSYLIYVPNGTYRVTSTIIYRGTTDAAMNNVRFVGQSRAGTLIRLDNNLAAFQAVSSPVPVLTYQALSDTFNNIATSNVCENLTVNTGSGNPGAVGIRFQGANTARMANVTVTSPDGKGYCGVWLKTGSLQAYLRDITVNGFGYGIVSLANAEVDTSWEHVSINNPTLAAVYMAGGGLAMRDLDLNQATLHVPAIQYTGTGASCVLLDSHLNGGSASSPAVVLTGAKQDFFGRNVTVSGYTVAVQNQGATAVAGPFVAEYSAHPVTTLFTVPAKHSFALPVQDTPIIPWETNLANWVNVDDYGTVHDGTTDDSTAVQAAFTAAKAGGKTVVYFPSQTYKIINTITVPAVVQRVDFMFGVFVGGTFSPDEASSNPIIFVGKTGSGDIKIAAARTVVAEFITANVYNGQTAPISTFLESCAGIGAGTLFCTAGQQVWGRSLNNELTSGNDILNNGATLWIMGYKTENKPCIAVESETGGFTEVLGGYTNAAGSSPGTTPMLENASSSLCFNGFTNSPTQKFTTAISETQGGVTNTEAISALPLRGSGYSVDVLISLYVGGARKSTSFGIFTGSVDIGSVGAVGSATSYGGSYFVDGSGADIGGTADALQFVDTTVSGNMTLVAKVDSVDPTDPAAKAGVIFRADAANADAPFVMVAMTAASGAVMESRATAGGAAATITNAALKPPCWVKLARSDSGLTGYTSSDGTTWTMLGTSTVTLPASVPAGLGVSSHAAGSVARSILEGVSLGATPPPPQITSQPQSVSATLGGAASFSVTASGTALTYQWSDNGIPLKGQTTATLSLTNLSQQQGGNYNVVVTNDSGTVTSTMATLTVTAGYTQWADQYFNAQQQADPGVSLPGSIPWGDGVPNLLKYVFDINPSRPGTPTDQAALPVAARAAVNGTPCLTLSYRLNTLLTGITVGVQTSADLLVWTTVANPATVQTGTDPFTGDPIIQVQIPVASTRQFARLKVSEP